MNKKKIIASILAVFIIFVVAMRLPAKKVAPVQETAKQPIKVSTISAKDSKTLLEKNQYPATVVGDQEVKITAKSSGTVTVAPGNIGEGVAIGSLLVKIDDTNTLESGDTGLKSLQIQQAEIAVELAKKSYDLAKKTYDNTKKSSASTKIQIETAKTQRDISKLQYENAVMGLTGNVDNHLITSPISGVITNKAVSVGDSVSAGQLLATVSKSSDVKVQFYVDQEQRSMIVRGQKISATGTNGNQFTLIIRNVSLSADPITKRFLIEAYPEKKGAQELLAGTIIPVSFETTTKPSASNNLLLPLSAISLGQNESYIFIVENNVAKKTIVQIANVSGENAEVSAHVLPETLIITNGSKLVQDGENVSIQN